MLERYGVENAFSSKKIRAKILDDNRKKYFDDIYDRIVNVEPLFKKEDYCGVSFLYSWKCKNCGAIFKDSLENGKNPRCLKCFPLLGGVSQMEEELASWLSQFLEVIRKNRSIIEPQELDIYIPSHKIAIEFDGLYWHSVEAGLSKDYHYKKTLNCEEKGVRLIHIFEDEWLNKKEIVKNRLKSILGLNKNKIYARNCNIKEIDAKTKNDFLNAYHIQGADKSSIKLGAYYQDELIGVMTFSKPRISLGQKNNKNLVYELSRFSNKSDIRTPGLASKLLSFFERNYDWAEIYSYADRRWSQGAVYPILGFKFNHHTGLNYWYVKDRRRFHRFENQVFVLFSKVSQSSPHLSSWLLPATHT
jgi:predicted Zn-ribbon and HTH transcriptional regulator